MLRNIVLHLAFASRTTLLIAQTNVVRSAFPVAWTSRAGRTSNARPVGPTGEFLASEPPHLVWQPLSGCASRSGLAAGRSPSTSAPRTEERSREAVATMAGGPSTD